jgi:hypothetical protein
MKIKDIKDKELRELAELRYEEWIGSDATLDSHVINFKWDDTPEGHDFWRDVNKGIIKDFHGTTTDNSEHKNPIFKKDDKDKQRKETPIFSGVLMYFPDAIREIAQCSFVANEQHNAGEPMHWAKHKSNQHADSLTRHLLEVGTVDTDGIRHATKVAWRSLALLQTELENAKKES